MKYILSQANNNTFVIVDILKEKKENLCYQQVHHILKKEGRDDALILTSSDDWSPCQKPVLQMLIYGLDGSFGEFCGNGALSCASYLFASYPFSTSFYLTTALGNLSLSKAENGKYSVDLPPVSFTLNEKFIKEPIPGFDYAEVLEPHLLIENDLSDAELIEIGRELNSQKELFPLGINVNAWQVIGINQLFVKTYERGVQRLTQSCGSGSTCCASFYRRKGEVSVKTPGGILEVSLQKDRVRLKGKASHSEYTVKKFSRCLVYASG